MFTGDEAPESGGPHREALLEILSRIPPRRGRWISCDAGWFALISEVHHHLVDQDPNYVVLQVKEKFGALRYYAGSSDTDPLVQERVAAILDIAERWSTTVCELCGEAARLYVSDEPYTWYKTLCTDCATRMAEGGGRVYRPYDGQPM